MWFCVTQRQSHCCWEPLSFQCRKEGNAAEWAVTHRVLGGEQAGLGGNVGDQAPGREKRGTAEAGDSLKERMKPAEGLLTKQSQRGFPEMLAKGKESQFSLRRIESSEAKFLFTNRLR